MELLLGVQLFMSLKYVTQFLSKPMNGKTINRALAGAVSAILDIFLTNAATKYSGKCVDIRNLSVR